MAPRPTAAKRLELKTRAWKLSLDGWSARRIAEQLGVHRDTIIAWNHESAAEVGQERKISGESEEDLNRYISVMRESRAKALDLYYRSMRRLAKEEDLELLHEAVRATPTTDAEGNEVPGKPPTTAITRALQYHMTGLPNALKAIDSAMRSAELEGKVLGLEALGKEEAARGLQEKLATFLALLDRPISVEVKMPHPTPEGWLPSGSEDED